MFDYFAIFQRKPFLNQSQLFSIDERFLQVHVRIFKKADRLCIDKPMNLAKTCQV